MRPVLLSALLLLATPAVAKKRDAPDRDKPTVGHALLFYVPNRVLDVLDIVRLRARVGPGVAVSVRATEAVDAYAGLYAAGYVGLPGPRNRRMPKMPLGIESKNGVEVSKADGTTSLFVLDPDYGSTEFGVGAQVLLVGADVGVDPGEFVDFLAGIVGKDLKDDDI